VNTASTKTPPSNRFSLLSSLWFFPLLFSSLFSSPLLLKPPTQHLLACSLRISADRRGQTQYLVPHEVLLEGIAVLEDLQAVGAEQVPRVLVDHSEVAVHLRVQRRAVLTHLKGWAETAVK